MKTRLECDFTVTWEDGETPDLNSFVDAVVGHLHELDPTLPVAAVTDPSDDSFAVALLLNADELEPIDDVAGRGLALIRTAFHALNAGTPNWPILRHQKVDALSV